MFTFSITDVRIVMMRGRIDAYPSAVLEDVTADEIAADVVEGRTAA